MLPHLCYLLILYLWFFIVSTIHVFYNRIRLKNNLKLVAMTRETVPSIESVNVCLLDIQRKIL